MITPDWKVRKLMEEYRKTDNLSKAAIRADVDRKTAHKYVFSGKLPSQMKIEHSWKTRKDPSSAVSSSSIAFPHTGGDDPH